MTENTQTVVVQFDYLHAYSSNYKKDKKNSFRCVFIIIMINIIMKIIVVMTLVNTYAPSGTKRRAILIRS